MPEGMPVVGWGGGSGRRDLVPTGVPVGVYEPPERLVGQLAARPTGAVMTVAPVSLMSLTIMWCSRWSPSIGCISTCGSRGWPVACRSVELRS